MHPTSDVIMLAIGFTFRPGNGSPSATNVVLVVLVLVVTIIRFAIC